MVSFKMVEKVDFMLGNLRFTQEFDGNGNHRLVVGFVVSDAVPYTSIATISVPSGVYASTSEFWQETLPRVFQIIPAHN